MEGVHILARVRGRVRVRVRAMVRVRARVRVRVKVRVTGSWKACTSSIAGAWNSPSAPGNPRPFSL